MVFHVQMADNRSVKLVAVVVNVLVLGLELIVNRILLVRLGLIISFARIVEFRLEKSKLGAHANVIVSLKEITVKLQLSVLCKISLHVIMGQQ